MNKLNARAHVPYIGVAGFMSSGEVFEAIKTVPEFTNYNLAIGVLASAKTIVGIPNRYPNRYPVVGELQDVVAKPLESVAAHDLPVQFILHYSTDTLTEFDRQMERVKEVVGDVYTGVQINMPPHLARSKDVARHLSLLLPHPTFASRRPRIILQLRPSRRGEPPTDLAEIALAHADNHSPVTDVLLDASGGSGRPMNVGMASTLIHSIRNACAAAGHGRHRFDIGVAGGLGVGRLDGVRELLSVHGPLSFDVESGVRSFDDRMNLTLLGDYLKEAWEVVG